MSEDLIAQIRAYSQQLAEEMIPVESEEGIPVVVAQKVFHPHLRPTRPRWVFGLAVVIAIFLFGLVVSLLRSFQAPPVATSDRLLPSVDTAIPSQGSVNGWVAFASYQEEWDGEQDIFLVGEGRAARRIIGSDSDRLDQMCPAFSPDGARLAYGQAEGTTGVGHTEGTLVISDLDPAGNASVALEIETGATSAPPCPIWSPDGRRIAVGVHGELEGIHIQGKTGADGDVWIVDLDGGQTTVLSGLYLATDLMGPWFSDMEWSPDGTELAISNDRVTIYSTLTGELRTVEFFGEPEGLSGAGGLTWSPDGTRIAFQYEGVILVAGVDDGAINVLADGVNTSHGIGPVWSPAGDRIVYQRLCHSYLSTYSPAQPCREEHDVVLATPDGGSEVVLPPLRLPGAEETDIWWPFRVTWSPDGQQLLYLAWGPPPGDELETSALIAVPIDPNLPPVMLHEDQWISVYAEGFQLGFQTWARQPVYP